MKKITTYSTFAVTLIATGFFIFSNKNQMMKEFQRQSYEKFLKEHEFNNRPEMTKKELKKKYAKKDRPDLAAEQNFLMTLDPNVGVVPRERLIAAFNRAEVTRMSRILDVEWTEHGPNNVAGRTRAVMFDPNDNEKKKFWAAGVTGGLWVTDDITVSNPVWNKVDDFWDNIAITCIAYDPTNTQIFYVGTGEIYTYDNRGFGIWKTIDGGATWSRLTSTNGLHYVNDILVREENGIGVLYVATGMGYNQGSWHGSVRGLMRSTNGGSSFTLPLQGNFNVAYQPSDLEIDADNNLWIGTRRNAWGDGGGTILKSSNGTSWTLVYENSDADRVELACARNNSDVIYAVGGSPGGSGDNDIEYFIKSTNGGSEWGDINIPIDQNSVHFTRGQAWYDLILAVSPNDENTLYAGGIDIHKSTDSGDTWTQLSHWYGGFGLGYVHADQHSFAFRPGHPNSIIFGNDGGIHMSIDAGSVFVSKNTGYNITQFYSVAMHPGDRVNYFLAGSQDNGTQQFIDAYSTVSTNEVTGGDGAYCFIDQSDPNIQMSSSQYNNWYISQDGFQTRNRLNIGNSGHFINPAGYDDNANILYTASNQNSLHRVKNLDGDYVADMINNNLGSRVSHISISEHSANLIFIGTSAGRLFKLENAHSPNPNYTELTGNEFPSGWISSVDIGRSDNELLVTFSNYGINSVWYTNNGGGNWVSKEGDLPDMPIRWALFNPDNQNEVLLATEIGVWSTETFLSNDPEWGSSNSGLANVRVDMLKFRSSDKHIVAATHGRGLFSTDHYVVPIPPNNAPVAQSINGQIDEDSSFQSYFIGDDEDDDAITISILTEPSDGIVSIGNNVYYDISYYDEQFESGIGCGAACSFGVRFTPASYPALLTSVLVSINSAGTESNATLLAYLDPSGGASGPEGDHITLATGVDLSANNEFHQVSILLDEEVLIESGDIYVVVKENGGFLSIANDNTVGSVFTDRTWFSTDNFWWYNASVLPSFGLDEADFGIGVTLYGESPEQLLSVSTSGLVNGVDSSFHNQSQLANYTDQALWPFTSKSDTESLIYHKDYYRPNLFPQNRTLNTRSDSVIFTYTPDLNFNGNDSFFYTVTDGDLVDTAIVSIVISPVNDAPIAESISVNVFEDSQYEGEFSSSDPDDDALSFSLVSQPISGSLVISGSLFTYTPDSSYNGLDVFDFIATDGSLSDTATISITVNPVNDAPIAESISVNVFEDSQYEGEFSSSDPDGDVLSYSVSLEPIHGDFSISGSSFMYAPDLNYYGMDSLDYIATDGSLSDTATISITINTVNDAPNLFSLISPVDSAEIIINDQSIEQGMQLDFSWQESSDVDGDSVVYRFILSIDDDQLTQTMVLDTLSQVNAMQIPHSFLTTIIEAYTDNYYLLGEWIIYATDGYDTTYSSTSRDIIFNATNLLESKNLIFPESFALHQNYPNPFNPITQIRYDLPIDEFISINIYDVIGRRIKSLINTKQGAGFRSITWNATNDLGQPVSAGMYIYTIQAGEFRQTRKMVLLK